MVPVGSIITGKQLWYDWYCSIWKKEKNKLIDFVADCNISTAHWIIQNSVSLDFQHSQSFI